MTEVHLYMKDGEWCYAVWVDREFDHSDTVGCADESTFEQAAEVLLDEFPPMCNPIIRRLGD